MKKKIYDRVSDFWEKIIFVWIKKKIYERNFYREKWNDLVFFNFVDMNVKDRYWRGW